MLEQMNGSTAGNAENSQHPPACAHQHLEGNVLSERRQKLAMLEQVLEDLGIEA